ncbi:MAG: hypothetical protein V8S92_05885, partial [Oscillospiraceae bacterium]
MRELHLTGGAFLDIGGASTEIVTFEDNAPVDFASFPIGSLSLYRRCVKKNRRRRLFEAAAPGDRENHRRERGRTEIAGTACRRRRHGAHRPKTGAALLPNIGRLPQHNCRAAGRAVQISLQRQEEAGDLILRLEAERIHTLVPGLLILQHVFHLFQAEQLVVSKYGVREGYLCQKILKDHTDTPKTGS